MKRLLLASLVVLATTATGLPARAQPRPGQVKAPAPGKLTKAPKLVSAEKAQWPASEGEPREVSVLLEIAIAGDGSVSDATVLESAGDALDQAAIAAVKQYRFEPAEIEDEPAAVKIKYRYDFKPEEKVTTDAPATAELAGVVRDGKTKRPLSDVKLELDNGVSAITDAAGRFSFRDVAPGKHSVTLSGPNFTPIGTEETLEPGKKYQATYDVELRPVEVPPGERSDFEIVVTAPRLEKKVASTEVTADQGARVAGTGGDVVKVVENMPGVARSTVGSGALVVWGAGAADTRVYVEGVHIPVLYHEGGFRSVVHSDLVRSVELQPGGYGASYGRGLGGLVTVGYRPLDDATYHGSIAVDAIDAAAAVRGPVSKNVHFAVAARRSHLDYVLGKVTSTDVGAFVPIPEYYDAQARLGWSPRKRESVEVGGLISHDRIERSLLAADPVETKSETKTTGFNRVYVSYKRETDDGVASFTPFLGQDSSEVVSRFGAVPAELVQNSTVYGLRTSWKGRAEDWLAVGVGLDAEVVTSSIRRGGSITTPPREGDIRVFGQLPGDQVNADDWTTTIAGLAPFAEADASLLDDRLHIIPGMRVEPSVVRSSRITPPVGDVPAVGTMREDTQLEPRLAVRFAASDRVTFKGAIGVYHQPPLAEDLSSVFGNPKLTPIRATHYLAGGQFQLTKPVSFELTSFYSRSHDLAFRSPLPSPTRAEALLPDGEGRAYGTQFLLRHDLVGRFFGWASLSIIRSERTDPGTNAWRAFDFDQTFVFTVVGSYDLGAGFEVGSRFRYTSGYPRTPVISASYDSRVDAYQPVFGAHNSIRIPAFYQLDVRVSKKLALGGSTAAELYLDVQNVTNHANPEEIVYNFDYSRRSYITGLPILPVIGGKLTW